MRAELLATLTVGRFFTDVGHSVREGFYMFWDTLWALVLGFALVRRSAGVRVPRGDATPPR